MNAERDDGSAAGDARRNDGGTPKGDREVKRSIHIADLSTRLRHACRHLSEDEFARLVFDMAETKLRFAAIEATSWPHPPSERDGG
jgi:hypothetical protein